MILDAERYGIDPLLGLCLKILGRNLLNRQITLLISFGTLPLFTILIFISLGIFDLKILLAFVASVLVSSCGGGSAKGGVLEISATVDPGYIEDNLYFLEGEYRFIKPKNASLVKHIDIGSDSVIFTKFVNGQVYIVAPNIDQITEINLEFTIELNDGTSLTEQTKLEISPINLNIPETRPLPYAFASSIGAYDAVSLDSNGVPLYNYKGEITYHPAYIAAYAYNHYRDYYYHENESSKKKFLDASMWLRDQCVYTTYGFCSYRYFNIENEYYEVYSDWTSAMAQGQALSSLIAASYLTDDSSYLDVAYDALSAFGYLAKDKGVMSFRSDLLWFEEYASETLDSGVLNSFFSQWLESVISQSIFQKYRWHRNFLIMECRCWNQKLTNLICTLLLITTLIWTLTRLTKLLAPWVRALMRITSCTLPSWPGCLEKRHLKLSNKFITNL